MAKAKIYIGTSGWHYKHWKGTFYPSDTSDSEQLDYYFKYFDTVEINNSFYMLPAAKTFDNWRKMSPKKFIFSVKASRYITHMKKLNADKTSINKFFRHAGALKEKMGPVLFQLPPHWKINAERLKSFLSMLPKDHRYTFEFRNETWYDESVYETLRQFNAAFCIYELQHHLTPIQVTADFIYIRLHGPGNKYQGSYTDQQLKKWAEKCKAWQKENKDVYIYFDNDQQGFAAFNAQRLKTLVQPSLSLA